MLVLLIATIFISCCEDCLIIKTAVSLYASYLQLQMSFSSVLQNPRNKSAIWKTVLNHTIFDFSNKSCSCRLVIHRAVVTALSCWSSRSIQTMLSYIWFDFVWSCVESGVGPDDPCGSCPPWDILQFTNLWVSFAQARASVVS